MKDLMSLQILQASFLIDFFIGVVSALLISKLIEPAYDSLLDNVKGDQGIVGNVYKFLTRKINKILYSKKLHPKLAHEGYEYKIYVQDGMLHPYCSKIINLRQTFFKRIFGEMNRIKLSGNTIQTFFSAYIKLHDKDYLIWEERYRSNEGNFQINAHYKLTNTVDRDIVGISIEQHKGKIVECLSILSFQGLYNSVRRICEANPSIQSYFEKNQININELSLEANIFNYSS